MRIGVTLVYGVRSARGRPCSNHYLHAWVACCIQSFNRLIAMEEHCRKNIVTKSGNVIMMGRRVRKNDYSALYHCAILSNGEAMWRRRINGSTAINCWPADQPVKCAHGSLVDYVAYASSIDTCMALISSVCCISCCISCTRLDHLTRVCPSC